MKETTLKQIADQLGISITTVSKSLKNYPDVSTKTKKAVIDLATKLNFTPNSFAVNLRNKESKTIGLIIPTIDYNFFSNVYKGILKEAEKRNYLVIILQSNEKYELEKQQINLLLNNRVDGILISLSNETDEFNHLKKVIEHKTPLVLFDKIAKIVNCSKVSINDRKAAYDAVTYLIKKGYKRIAHFRGSYLPQNYIDRFLGYKKALEDNHIVYDPALVYLCDKNKDFEDGYDTAKQALTENPDIDAIFAVTDLVAVGIIKYLNDEGIKIPEDVAVFGFCNSFMSSIVSPKLTTIDQPGFEIGKNAASILFDEINLKKNDKPITFKSIQIETTIIERNSA